MNSRKLGTWCGRVILLSGLLIGALFSSAAAQAAKQEETTTNRLQSNQKAANPTVTLEVKGKSSSQQGQLFSNKTWIPLTFVRDELKLDLSYESISHSYILAKGPHRIRMIVQDSRVNSYLNSYYLGQPEAKLIKGKMYIPFQWLKDYLGYEGIWDGKLKKLNVVQSKMNDLDIETVSHQQDNADAVISLSYPSIKNMSKPKTEQAINKVLEKDLEGFQKEIQEALLTRDSAEGLPPYEFHASFVITYNQKGILSLFIDKYQYLGGAHGMTVRKAYTFSLEDGQLLSMEDLFGDRADYMKIVNDQLKKGFGEHPGYFGGFTGLREASDYVLQPDRVTLFFQVYEYTPYAAGIPEFSILYDDLLKKNSKYQRLRM